MGDNKKLAEEIRNIPKKFSEIARQNRKLIKETSEMHYNLGVFYTKNKEYDRAVAEFEKVVKASKTIFWNGPVGIFEMPAFASGSIMVANAMAEATRNGSNP